VRLEGAPIPEYLRPMRALRSLVVVSLLAAWHAAPARAGYVMEHETLVPDPATMKPMRAKVKSWRDHGRIKRENPLRNEWVILDVEKREVVGINDQKKTYWRIPSERYRGVALASLTALGVDVQADGKVVVPPKLFVPTGQRAIIEGRKAHELRCAGKQRQGLQTSLWVSSDVKVPLESLVDELRASLGGTGPEGVEALFAQWRALPGYPVQTVTTIATASGMVTTSETLLSVREEAIPASTFAVPAGYARVDDPLTELEGKKPAAPVGIGAPLKPAPQTDSKSAG
jgi:hypothetical protein